MIGIALLDQLTHDPLGTLVGLGNRVPDCARLDLDRPCPVGNEGRITFAASSAKRSAKLA